MNLCKERLPERRRKLKMTKKSVADKTGITAQAYAYLEEGKRSASYPVILLLSLALETSVSYLTGETDSPEPDRVLLKIDEADDLSSFIADYRRLPPNSKRLIRGIVKELISK